VIKVIIMPFEKGNQVAKKLPTDELKQDAYAQYCAHIAKGYPKKAWCFEHPTLTLTWETMEKYIKNEPDVFDSSQKKVAESKSLNHWFSYLSASATGANQKANVASLQIILRNMHAWDKADNRADDTSSDVATNQEKIMSQLAQRQQEEQEAPSSE
jgi:hypothetical protein